MIMALILWWYGAGWSRLMHQCSGRILSSLEFFSVSLLLRTLFDPFRQIGTDGSGQSLDAQVRAWGDRMFSRMVGFMVRSMVIVFGLSVAATLTLVSMLQILAWPFVPAAPLIGFWLMLFKVGA